MWTQAEIHLLLNTLMFIGATGIFCALFLVLIYLYLVVVIGRK